MKKINVILETKSGGWQVNACVPAKLADVMGCDRDVYTNVTQQEVCAAFDQFDYCSDEERAELIWQQAVHKLLIERARKTPMSLANEYYAFAKALNDAEADISYGTVKYGSDALFYVLADAYRAYKQLEIFKSQVSAL